MPGATASCLGTIKSCRQTYKQPGLPLPFCREGTVKQNFHSYKGEYRSSRDTGVKAPPYSCQVPPWDCLLFPQSMVGNKSGQFEICLDNRPSWFACFCRTLPACLMTCKQNPLHESHTYTAQTASTPFPGKRGTLITNLASRAPSVHVVQQSVYSVVLQTMNYTIQELDEVLTSSSNLPPPP